MGLYAQPSARIDVSRLAHADELIGRVLGLYRLEGLLGVGGTGCVFRGRHVSTDAPCAIKLVYCEVDAVQTRFRREIEAVTALDHPNIVKFLDHGKSPADRTYMVMG